jgi:hypothetical protein
VVEIESDGKIEKRRIRRRSMNLGGKLRKASSSD